MPIFILYELIQLFFQGFLFFLNDLKVRGKNVPLQSKCAFKDHKREKSVC